MAKERLNKPLKNVSDRYICSEPGQIVAATDSDRLRTSRGERN